ncbi:MAG TPA: GNAT family N-acetyltransferase, partial [Polyangiaceae bacterium]|nr:GNAT family N-acetyltransferase [Polyangiaceae bacterium]
MVDQRRDQMLKLVAKGFFNELVNYGVRKEEIVRVTSHLLDNLLAQQSRLGGEARGARLDVDSVLDEWHERRSLTVDQVRLSPFEPSLVPLAARWLAAPGVREGFVPALPAGEAELAEYFARPGHDYFAIHWQGAPVGFIGGENVDLASGKLEMKKLVGEPDLQGKGIGKRATFAFLYYAFMIAGLHKVYIHSRDINVRNISLNSGFGFELEALAPSVTASQYRGMAYGGGSIALDTALSWMLVLEVQEQRLAPLLLAHGLRRRLPPVFDHLPIAELDERAFGSQVHYFREWTEQLSPDSPYWSERDFSSAVGDLRAPVQLVGGWYDIFLPW